MGLKDVLPAARTLVQSSGDESLRLAAITTLGDVGEASDAALLKTLTSDRDQQVRKAAANAVEKIDRRQRAKPGS